MIRLRLATDVLQVEKLGNVDMDKDVITEIAGRLIISPLTVKTHVSRILGKLSCRDRAQLVALAYETGLVTPGALEAAEALDQA